jgi:hypothetical protein
MTSGAGTGARPGRILVVATVAGLLLMVVGVGPAVAHETREVGGYLFTVGWIDEPAYTGVPNAVDLRVRFADTEEPFEDLGDDLQVDITYGDATTTQGLRPRFGDPGGYRSDVVPTRPGTWEFRFHGTVGGQDVDETFVSGPDTFNDIQEPGAAAFPQADPSTAELAERVERELARVEARLGDVEAALGDVDSDHDAMGDDAAAAGEQGEATAGDSVARIVSLVAVVLGALAVLLALRRRPS